MLARWTAYHHGKDPAEGVLPREHCVGKVGWEALFLRCDEGFAAGVYPEYSALDEPSLLTVGWWELGAACAVDPHKERDVCLAGNMEELNLMAAAANDESLAPDAAARATKAADMHGQPAATAEA